MASGLDATKTAARPSHEAIESSGGATEMGKTEQERIDHEAMKMAKRAQNVEHADQDKIPGSDIFTK
jgi:hypothetical protein